MEYDTSEIAEQGSFTIPEGEYVLKVMKVKEGTTQKGDYKVTCDLVVDGPTNKGFELRFHTVTFMSDPKAKGAGMSKNWLKCLGEPYEGKIEIRPLNWVRKRLTAYLVPHTYNGYESMKIQWVKPLDVTTAMSEEISDVPF